MSGLIVIVIGGAYCVMEGIPSISPPQNMNPEGLSIGIDNEIDEDAPVV